MSGSTEKVAAGIWLATGYTSQDGAMLQAWSVPLPHHFIYQLHNDIERLKRDVEHAAYATRAKVIESGYMTVDGKPAFYRIVAMPGAGLPTAAYVASVVIAIESPLYEGPEW